jgi:hypothetical protein
VPWHRRFVDRFSPRRTRFDPKPVNVGFVVDEVALEEGFSPSTSVFTSQCHSTDVPYSFTYH